MRPLHHSDICEVVRVLLPLSEEERPRALARFIAFADAADRFRQVTGRMHRAWGDGTLGAAVARQPRHPARSFEDFDYAQCWSMVLEAVIRFRTGRRLSP
ncbi:hypothetical protein [Vannielia litorea]|uniref:DUF7742 domain-containing protein n=1 Tax=Vannielia litorea TaxID=1217970 RepID=A0A1N6F1Z2_9RHOB|nr:hypothetical protein [Vannielia litorea]SIN89302.1 hypothetical protein SAMN05444002_1301 [Vannielia litorea]